MFAAIASFHTALMALCFLSSATLRRKDVRLDAVQFAGHGPAAAAQ